MSGSSKTAWGALAALLLLPLISMAVIPFYDTSEPRYAETARMMAQSGDWITPWFSPGVPFWGKPPLSFWAQALSMKAFGFTEFAGRLPSWICLLLTTIIFLTGLKSLRGPRVALWTAIVYSSCALPYISSGAVLTDPFLALGTTLSLVSFAVVAQHGSHSSTQPGGEPNGQCTGAKHKHKPGWWPYGFFLGLAVGLLAKGPLAIVLSGAPVLLWLVLNRKTATAASLPWGKGVLLVAALSAPWYILAEIKTPGFLDYFIVGEHFRRFLDPGWAGDLYGSAHRRVYGTIWIYWLQASFPWGALVLAAMCGALRSSRLRMSLRVVGEDPLFSYWLASALITPLFFTFSANILWTYLLPSLAAFSVLAGILIEQVGRQFSISMEKLLASAIVVPVVGLVLSIYFWTNPDVRNTERTLVRYVHQDSALNIPLFYLSTPPFSAQFYSAGRVKGIEPDELRQAVDCGMSFYLAIPKDQQKAIAQITDKPAIPIFANKRYFLVKMPATG
ncbi:phospholipid carrier-dependent glycosyltransferase [Pollutimonas nitritireducens]|uniref:Phospholipid carrier-dependent glycosyltransferase n=1 Tax=Pollutimonas nitritireducens TaxID=2045209 RepID=A0A2N4UGY6_9BURK|nr:glycosyltransferase family 39 protein [Pollutimonas nitritireducens]PLC54294.1 phospholipid carrier-dependent glycosyltransferase [Pollutimonas nitritireducens]